MSAVVAALLCCCAPPPLCACNQTSFLMTWPGLLHFAGCSGIGLDVTLNNPSVIVSAVGPCIWSGQADYTFPYGGAVGTGPLVVRVTGTLTWDTSGPIPKIGFMLNIKYFDQLVPQNVLPVFQNGDTGLQGLVASGFAPCPPTGSYEPNIFSAGLAISDPCADPGGVFNPPVAELVSGTSPNPQQVVIS